MKAMFFLIAMTVSPMLFQPNLTGISKAISEGDYATLGTYFDQNVELTVLDKQDQYDKAQATQALKDFFSKNQPKSFSPVHQGNAKGGTSHYTIGDLTASTGNFRVYLYYKTVGDKFIIQEMRIEK